MRRRTVEVLENSVEGSKESKKTNGRWYHRSGVTKTYHSSIIGDNLRSTSSFPQAKRPSGLVYNPLFHILVFASAQLRKWRIQSNWLLSVKLTKTQAYNMAVWEGKEKSKNHMKVFYGNTLNYLIEYANANPFETFQKWMCCINSTLVLYEVRGNPTLRW